MYTLSKAPSKFVAKARRGNTYCCSSAGFANRFLLIVGQWDSARKLIDWTHGNTQDEQLKAMAMAKRAKL